jgi:hypothetical protein
MTTRERVNKVRRRSFLIGMIGFIMFAGGITASERHREFTIVGFSGFALFGGSIIYMLSSGRCVHCQRPVGRVFQQSGTPFAISSDLQFCPYCGKSIDDDITI